MEVDKLLTEIKGMNPISLFLLIIGFAIAKLPAFVLQKDKNAIEARDALIKTMQDQILSLQSEIKDLKKEIAMMKGEDE